MKRIALFLALITITATIAIAQQPRRMGPGGPPPPPRLNELLNLTPAQETQIDALHDSLRTTIDPLFEAKRAEDEKLHSLIESANPDATAIGKQVLAVRAIDQQIRAAHDAMDQKISALLTADQRVKFEALIALRHMGPPPPPPPPR